MRPQRGQETDLVKINPINTREDRTKPSSNHHCFSLSRFTNLHICTTPGACSTDASEL